LKVNLLDLPRPDATRETVKEMMEEGENGLLARLDYAAAIWFRHVDVAQDDPAVQGALAEDGILGRFLRTRCLEWLECLSLLDQLPRAVEALKTLSNVMAVSVPMSLFTMQTENLILLTAPCSVADLLLM
jgi:hypothetical protein